MLAAKDEQNADDSPSQQQDPIERRRLQNRLSQRNHRRKIRDRIAKLQERVIASELRAAASLNGWDQADIHTLPSIDLKPQGEFSRSPLSPTPETPVAVNTPHTHGTSSTSLCFSCSNAVGQIPVLSPIPSPPSLYDFGSTNELESTSSSSTLLHSTGLCSSRSTSLSSDTPLNMNGILPANEMNLSLFSEPLNFQQQQQKQCPLYYIATETSLPQIMQALGTGASRPKAIILIPQDKPSAGISSTLSSSSADPAGAMNALDLQNLVCHCHRTTDPVASGDWLNPSSYPPICPLHSTSSLDDYQTMML